MRDRAARILHTHFNPESAYWQYFDKYVRQYTGAVAHQVRYHFKKYNAYSRKEMEMIMAGVSAMAKTISTAMDFLSSRTELITLMEKSLDYYYIGKGLKDDVQDWREDFNNHRYSYTLSVVIERNKLEERLDGISVNEMGKLTFFSGIVEELLGEVTGYYNKALDIVQEIRCARWKDLILSDIRSTSRIMLNVKTVKDKEITRTQQHNCYKAAVHV